jgi:hypothetical protein
MGCHSPDLPFRKSEIFFILGLDMYSDNQKGVTPILVNRRDFGGRTLFHAWNSGIILQLRLPFYRPFRKCP